MGTTHQLFSTPVHETILPEFDSVKDKILDLVKVCLDEGIKRQTSSFTKPNDSRMSITKDLYLQNDVRFKFLVDLLDKVIYQYWLDCDYDPNIKPKITNMWGIINKPEGFTPPHTHSPAIITGCLYINATSETGDFQLDHPMKNVLGYMPYNRVKYPPPFHFSETFKVEPGKVVLFPGWAIHYAKMNNTDFDRYAIAFNVGELVVAP